MSVHGGNTTSISNDGIAELGPNGEVASSTPGEGRLKVYIPCSVG